MSLMSSTVSRNLNEKPVYILSCGPQNKRFLDAEANVHAGPRRGDRTPINRALARWLFMRIIGQQDSARISAQLALQVVPLLAMR